MTIARRSPRIAVNDIKSRSKARVASVIAKRISFEKEEMRNLAKAKRILERNRRKNKLAATKKLATKKKKKLAIVVAPKKERKKTPTTKRSSLISTAQMKGDPMKGVVDPASGIQGGSIVGFDGEPCDVMLALVDPSKNTDKFYLLQIISVPSLPKRKYITFFRWGRTGTQGQSKTEHHTQFQPALDSFLQKFKEKTGLTWQKRNDPTIDNKYFRFVKQNFNSRNGGYRDGKWQYWVDDGVDGKRTGWYDYTEEGSTQTERLFQEHQRNERLGQRVVQSGYFSYRVNLQQMTQTNVTHSNHTTRRIQRVPR